MKKPFAKPPMCVRQRQRADGSWRVWWEPSASARAHGFDPVELDAAKLTASKRRADQLNDKVAMALGTTGRADHRARTVTDLRTAYLASPEFTAKRPATQRDYRQAFSVIEDKWGSTRIADMTKAVVHTWYETLYRTRGVAASKAIITKLSILFSYADRKGWIDANPALRLKMTTPPARNRVVSWAEQDHLVDTAIRLGETGVAGAILLGALQGQRATDILQLTGAHVTGGRLRLRQSKRGSVIDMALHPEVTAWLDSRDSDDTATPLCVNPRTGAPYAQLTDFSRAFRRVRTQAIKTMPTLADMTFRDLRRTFNARATAGGATAKDRADARGNTIDVNPALERIYNPASSAAADAAVTAIQRPLDAKKRNSS